VKPLPPRFVKAAALSAAVLIGVCVVVLSVDYAGARSRERADEQRIAAMQEKVRADAALAPQLEAEKNRVAVFYRARRSRINVISWVLLAAAACFLSGAKRLLKLRPAPPEGKPAPAEPVQPVCDHSHEELAPKAAPEVDLAVVDAIVAREGTGAEAAIPILQAIQAHFRYLPDEALRRVCETTAITPAQIAGTSSFYSRFRRSAVGEHIVCVCHGTACHVAGARQITDELRRSLRIAEGADTDPSGTFTIEEVACLGCCSLAPVLMVDQHTAGKLRPATAREALDAARPGGSA
jgi:NADH:ubiquinone oxidoreductase subunit E